MLAVFRICCCASGSILSHGRNTTAFSFTFCIECLTAIDSMMRAANHPSLLTRPEDYPNHTRVRVAPVGWSIQCLPSAPAGPFVYRVNPMGIQENNSHK